MAETSKIEWTDSTFNPWIGCTNISAGCDHCYAEDLNNYRGWVEWGPHGTRRLTADSTWKHPVKWERDAVKFQAQHGRRQRVFCASLADVFDNRAPAGARERLFALIKATPNLDWQLLTKRPENMKRFLPADWGDGYPNVWLGTTTEDQESFDRRWSILRATPAAVRFISYEPAIGPVNLLSAPWIPGRLYPSGRALLAILGAVVFADSFHAHLETPQRRNMPQDIVLRLAQRPSFVAEVAQRERTVAAQINIPHLDIRFAAAQIVLVGDDLTQ